MEQRDRASARDGSPGAGAGRRPSAAIWLPVVLVVVGLLALLFAVADTLDQRDAHDDAPPRGVEASELARQQIIDAAGPGSGQGAREPAHPLTVSRPGQVVEGGHYSSITVKATDVTLRDVTVTTTARYGVKSLVADGLVIEDSLLDCTDGAGATSACLYATGTVTVRRSRIVAFEADAIKARGGTTLEGNYISVAKPPESEHHTDVLQIRQGSGIRVVGNVLVAPADEGGNATMIIQTAEGPIDDVLIEGNWLYGGNFTIYTSDKQAGFGCPTTVRIIDNRIGRDFRHGVHNGCVDEWRGNTWADTGAPIPAAAS